MTAKISGLFKSSSLESTSSAWQEFVNFVAILPSRLYIVREASSVKISAYVYCTSAAAAASAPSPSANPCYKQSPQ